MIIRFNSQLIKKMAVQEGLERYNLKEDYYDIMLIGITGQGKSTTADKLLIANLDKIKYEIPEDSERQSSDARIKIQDISMWLLHQEDENVEVETLLKAITFCRTKPQPHVEVNKVRDPKNEVFTAGTASCRVLSNDTTKIRIMDVPGFYAGDAFNTPDNQQSSICNASKEVTNCSLGIMRNIIRIQSALGMCFRRIVYFIPHRGPLERINALLKTDLTVLEAAFGLSIFECMVAVATISRRQSLKDESDDEKFPSEDIQQCERFFQMALKNVLCKNSSDREPPKVPIIFISLAESCESILTKVKGAKVSCDGLKLNFNPNTCANCGIKIGLVNGERVACSFQEDFDSSIPYEESTCHPAFKVSLLRKITGSTIFGMISRRWPSYKEEYCIKCNSSPFMHGCTQVNGEYKTRWGKRYIVDHTNLVSEPEIDDQVDQHSNTAHPTTTTP